MRKSPSGSTFPYYYKGGEIHAFKYGSYDKDEDRLLSVMRDEETFVQTLSQRQRVWVDFYETTLSNRLMLEFVRSINKLQEKLVKLALVGLSRKDQRRMTRMLKKKSQLEDLPLRFYDDPEDAKTWLVSGQ